jgi:hypothetical protein
MATPAAELQVLISVVDRLTGELAKLTTSVAKIEQSAEQMNKKIEESAKDSRISMIALNSAVELVQKTLKLTASVVSFPIKAFSELSSVVTDLVREYDVQAQAEVRLTTALRLQGEAATELAEDLKAYATELQKTTRFGDEAIINGEALLATFIKDADQIKRATQAALDLAAALGLDAAQGFQKVLQAAESGSITIGRMSVQLSAAEDPAKRLAESLAALETKFGGLSQEVAKVGAGPLDQATNAISDVREEVGNLITKTPEFQAFIDTIKELSANLIAFAQNNSSELIAQLGKAFSITFTLASAAIEGLVFASEKLVKASDAILTAFGFFDSESQNLQEDIDETNASITRASDVIRDMQGVVDGTATGFKAFITPVSLAQSKIEQLNKFVGEQVIKLGELEAKLAAIPPDPFDKLRESASSAVGELSELLRQADEIFKKNLGLRQQQTPEAADARRAESIRRASSNVEQAGLTGALDPQAAASQSAAIEELKQSALDLQESAAAETSQVAAARALDADTASDFATVTENFDGNLLEWGKNLTEEDANLAAFATSIVQQQTAATDLSSSGGKLTGSAADLTGAAGSLSAAAGDLGSGLAGLDDIAGQLGNAVDGLEDAAREIKSAADTIANAGGGDEPHLASGAIVRRPTRALIGESGSEAVIPLNEEGIDFARRALGLGASGGAHVSISARNLTLSERGLSSVFAQFERRLNDDLLRARRLRSGSL